MRNRIIENWSIGKPVLNGWLSIPSPVVAEVVSEQGYDAVTIDLQHGLVDYQAMLGMLQAMRASGAAPLVRVPWLDPASIMKALDAGALGIICPMIDTPEQAAELASYVRYPPHGTRSFGPTRANYAFGPDYADNADELVTCFAMIETQSGFDNMEAIVATEGVAGLYIGPADLTFALTGRKYRVGFDREEPEMLDAIHKVLDTCERHGKRAALHCGSAEYAARAVSWGFDLVTLVNDVRLLAVSSSQNLKDTRDLILNLKL